MRYRKSVFKRWVSCLTMMTFIVFNVMPSANLFAITCSDLGSPEAGGFNCTDSGNGVSVTTLREVNLNLGNFDSASGSLNVFDLSLGNFTANVIGNNPTLIGGNFEIMNGVMRIFNANGVHVLSTADFKFENGSLLAAAGNMNKVTGKIDATGFVLNEGNFHGTGDLALVGKAVENRGTIDLPANHVFLAGGKVLTVGLSGDNLVSVVVDEDGEVGSGEEVFDFEGKKVKNQIENSGREDEEGNWIDAKITGNKVTLDAKGVDSVFEKAINLKGEIKAVDVVQGPAGEIQFLSMDDVYNNAILEASKIEMNTDGKIENAGTIDAKEFKEHGYTFKNTGTLQGGKVLMDNTDGAADISGVLNVDSVEDTGDINLVGNVTLGRHVTMMADSDANGTGKITFSDGISLSGSGSHYNLTLRSSGQSVIRSMDNLGDLVLSAQTAGAQFTLRRGIDMYGDLTVNSGATLDGGFSVTVRGGDVTGAGDINMTGGTFSVLGNGTFGGTQDWNFNQLVFGDGAAEAATQKTGANKITIAQDWTIKELHTLRGGSSTWDVTWGGGALTNITKIASGGNHTLALSATNGNVYAWGSNINGELGIGIFGGSRLTPELVRNSDGTYLSGATEIAAGENHSLAIVNGGAKAWGRNLYGQLGNNSTTNSSTPVNVTGLSSGVTAISAGMNFSLAIVSGGLKSWGLNDYGQLGNNSTTNSSVPVNVTGLSSGVTAIAAGYQHALAIVSGAVKAWGNNQYGQLGNNSTVNNSSAIDVIGLSSGVTAISAGNRHSLAIWNGGAMAWGGNEFGQLGNNSTTNSSTPVSVMGLSTGVTAVAAGQWHSLAIMNDSVKGWGKNTSGELGIDTQLSSSTPVSVLGLSSGISKIATQGQSSFALKSDGTVNGWGNNLAGQLGDATTSSRKTPVTTLSALNLGITKLTDVVKIVTGSWHTLALLSNGTVKSWGVNNHGQLGNDYSSSFTPVDVVGLQGVTDIAAGGDHSLAIVNGGVKAWGWNLYGQLGNNNFFSDGYSPVDVIGLSSGVTAISAGLRHSLAIVNGGVKAWGDNDFGQLGNNSTTDSPAPVSVTGLSTGVTAISAGGFHSLAIVNGGVKAWGFNGYGQLGNNSTTNSSTPVNVTGLSSGVTSIAAGYSHSLAATSGAAMSWGSNAYGQLGDYNTSNRSTPVTVIASGVTAVSAGDYHSLAVVNGGAKSWGYNPYGQLGLGSVFNPTGNRDSPQNVSGLSSGATQIDGGQYHSAALIDGNVKLWGHGQQGQLGNNNNVNVSAPVFAGSLVFNPFVINGTFVEEDSTVSYSGDIVIGGQQIATRVADTYYSNLILRNQAQDYVFRGDRASVQDLKSITVGKLTIQGEIRKTPVVDTNIVVDRSTRMMEIMDILGADRVNAREIFKMLFEGGGHEMRVQELRTGMNEFNVDPSSMGFDRGMDQFRETVFGAQVASLEQRVTLDQTLKTGTTIQNVTGNVRVIASDGKIYDAQEGAELQEGDQVVTDSGSKVELSKGEDKVTVSEGSAVQVQKQSDEVGKPVQDLLTLAFGKVSVAVSSTDGKSNFVLQAPSGMSGNRG